ncbi:MAG: GNAT family N-acetyltransferase [Clostridiales bacterium]|nr:GNAT family N-acetyltransferase [Clostridiales bacterium]
MSIDIVNYSDGLKGSLFDFTGRCFEELGKRFEPSGRHSNYNDIPGNFVMFDCLIDGPCVCGTVALKELDHETAELKALYLDRELRGRGYGRRLISSAVSFAREHGYKKILLDSMSQYEDARRLYERMGFVDTERYNDNPYADVFMRLDLSLTEPAGRMYDEQYEVKKEWRYSHEDNHV